MAVAAAPRPANGGRVLSDKQIAEVLGLLTGSDTVELKMTVADDERRSAIQALEIDPLDAQIRLVTFFDTPELTLNKAGVVVRARRIQGKGDDSTIKLRPVVPHELPASLRALSGFGVEVDAMPGGFVCSGSLSQPVTRVEASDVLRGEAPIRKLFSKAQRAFYAEHAPAGIDLDSLTILGPIFVLKRKWVPKGQKRAMVAEVWIYPDGSMLLELSTKTVPDQAFKVAAETREFLTGRGISLSGAQETKTRKALDFFSARARALARASA